MKAIDISVVRSSIQSYPGILMATVCAVVYYVRAAHALSAGIKCLHCSLNAKRRVFSAFYCIVLYCMLY